MAKKNKRVHGQRRGEVDHFALAERELGKHNAKQALKSARLSYQEQQDEPRRQLLQRALAARAQQLYDAGNPAGAKELLAELEGLGALQDSLLPQLQRLQVLLGVGGAGGAPAGGAGAGPAADTEILLADEAILHPHRRSPAYPEINRQADLVREALRDVERGDEAAALDRMAPIPRRSPFADWRLFVRGLAAHYAGDEERSASNWDRLDRQRPAHRISRTLLVFAGNSPGGDEQIDVSTGLRRLNYAVSQADVTSDLEMIRDLLQQGREGAALDHFRSLQARCGRSQPRLLQRLTEMLWKRFAADADLRYLRTLGRVASPPPLDPQWHRAYALCLEHDEDASLDELRFHWMAYIQDLERNQLLREDERRIAAGLVSLRVAREFVHSAEGAARAARRYAEAEEREAEADSYRTQAAEFFRKAIDRHPGLLEAHRELISLQLEMDRSDAAYQASLRLLEHFPDDFQTLVWVSDYLIESGKPAEAEPYVDRACQLRPRDPAVPGLIWHQRQALLRDLLRRRQFDTAREKLQEAFASRPADVPPYTLDVLQAVIEYRAKRPEQAEQHVQAAIAQLDEPTVIWLMLHSAAARFGLNQALKNDFRDRLKAALKWRPTSQTAGRAAAYLLGFVARKIKYVGLATHQRLLVDYLGRCRPKKLDWRQEDLRSVCRYLRRGESWRSQDLLEKFVEEGCRRFPRDPLFRLLRGLGSSPARLAMYPNQKVGRDLEAALELNDSGEQRLSEAELQEAKETLARQQSMMEMLEGMQSLWGRLPEFFSRMALGDEDDDDYYEDEDDDYDEDDYDDEDDDDEDEDDEDGEWGWFPEDGAEEEPRSPGGRSKSSRRRGSDKGQRFFPF